MPAIIFPYAVLSIQILVAMCRYILALNIRGVGEIKFYLPKKKEEGEANIMLKAFAQATVYLLPSEETEFMCKSL